MMKNLFSWLKLPEKKQTTDLDDPAVTLLHGEIIQQKPLLRNIYVDFYKRLKNAVGDTESKTVVELGSGGGFIKELIPGAITSDVIEVSTVDQIFSATEMPFEDSSIDAFVMMDVLHHIYDPSDFFKEALRCLTPGGKIVMIEPAATPWARFVYKNFHHESFDLKAGWQLEEGGPLSHGNAAMSWVILSRDRKLFENRFPALNIRSICNHTPFKYLVSGGFTFRQLLPSFTWTLIAALEYILSPLNNLLGMFQTIVLEKTDN